MAPPIHLPSRRRRTEQAADVIEACIDLTGDPSPPPPPPRHRPAAVGSTPTDCIVISDDDDDDDDNDDPRRPAPYNRAAVHAPTPFDDYDDYDRRSDDDERARDSDDDDDKSLDDFLRGLHADNLAPCRPTKRLPPSFTQMGEQPMRKKLFSSAPLWRPSRPRPAVGHDSDRQLPQLDHKPADRAPDWINETTPIRSRKARLQQLRLAN